ncbi:MAG: hypothetical protein ACXAB2_06880 [Candidatus Hodarchaeales archaeon]|jgi:hypothetical protein
MTRKPLRKFLLVGLISLIIGIVCISFGLEVYEADDMIYLLLVGIILAGFGSFLIILFIAPGTVLRLFGQRPKT